MKKVICASCGKEIPTSEIKSYDGEFFCPDCMTECDRCGERLPYGLTYSSVYGRLCDCCYGDLFG